MQVLCTECLKDGKEVPAVEVQLCHEHYASLVEWHEIHGKWPKHCLHRAFVDGAAWWEYQRTGATMWRSDRDLAEQTALERYGDL